MLIKLLTMLKHWLDYFAFNHSLETQRQKFIQSIKDKNK